MSLRIPFFGLLSQRSPMKGLIEHYEKISRGLDLIEESLECYISGGGACKEYLDLYNEVDSVESQADKIKRSIRNHLPRGLFMPVDKIIFFNYTRSQDNILDDGQTALHWLLMRPAPIAEHLQKQLVEYVSEVLLTVRLLEPALQAGVDLVLGTSYDRQGAKDKIRAVRKQHRKVWHLHTEMLGAVLGLDQDFKDIYQLIHFVESMHGMSHNTEGCVDLLRAMIAR